MGPLKGNAILGILVYFTLISQEVLFGTKLTRSILLVTQLARVLRVCRLNNSPKTRAVAAFFALFPFWLPRNKGNYF
jgi:hypothetical protein